MEFLRFGSSIPGAYWGCCAMDIIQNFKFDPDSKSSIQMVNGDAGVPELFAGGKGSKFAGPTYRDIFWTRLRVGTFGTSDMSNHAFLAVLTEDQVNGGYGRKWLTILKEAGFEFIRAQDNSVYTGNGMTGKRASHKNYLFGLFRNINSARIDDPFAPPQAWLDMEDPYNGDMTPENMTNVQKVMWDKIGPPKFLTEDEVKAAGAPVILAGLRSENAQEPKEYRDARNAMKAAAEAPRASAFPSKSAAKALAA